MHTLVGTRMGTPVHTPPALDLDHVKNQPDQQLLSVSL